MQIFCWVFLQSPGENYIFGGAINSSFKLFLLIDKYGENYPPKKGCDQKQKSILGKNEIKMVENLIIVGCQTQPTHSNEYPTY